MNAITIAQLAEQLGVSRMTIYRMRKAGELPPIIPTKRRIVRWMDTDIGLWIELDCPSTNQFIGLKKTKQRFARKNRRR